MSVTGHTCYGGSGDNVWVAGDGIPLLPDSAIPGQNTQQTQGSPEPPVPTLPGQEVREVVGNCYGPVSPVLIPDTTPDIPRTTQGPPIPAPEEDPGEVIRTIVARCYPVAPPPPVVPPDVPDDPTIVGPIDPCELLEPIKKAFPSLEFPFCPNDWTWDLPVPWKPDGPFVGRGSDCDRVILGLAEKTVRKSEDPMKVNIYVVILTGEELYCDLGDDPGDQEWGECVKDAIDCIFKPYVSGTWRAPAADCDTQYFRGQNSDSGEICVKNCFPQRVPIYEYKKGDAPGNVQIMPFGNGFHNKRLCTTDTSGNWNQQKVRCEGGNAVFNSTATQTQTFTANGLTITVKVTPINDGGEYDSRWWVESFTGTMPAVGTTWNHSWNGGKGTVNVKVTIIEGPGSGQDTRYGREAIAPAGYSLVNADPSFYILDRKARGSIPLYRFYSPTNVDTFLTTNPGSPDTTGAGERATMDAQGMTQGEILGYVFRNKEDAIPYVGERESIRELHRYYAPSSVATLNDHMYSLQQMDIEQPPVYGQRLTYRLPNNPKTSWIVSYKMVKPSAAYQNSWGVYIANENATEIYWTKTIKANVNVNNAYGQFEIPLTVLKQYPNKQMGFYLIPNGNNYGVSDNDSPTFTADGSGWKRSGGSAQSGWVFFSDPYMNPDNRTKTRWVGDNWQWWEDLLNGDDDYTDFKVHYEVLAPGSAYRYEGVQCYLYEGEAPPRTTIPIKTKDECSTATFDGEFMDVALTRSQCGSANPTYGATGVNIDCGTCSGGYVIEINRTQTIKALRSGTFQLKAFGSIITNTDTDCMTFRFTLKKNGSTSVVDETYEIATWPDVGYNIGTSFSLSEGDTLTLKAEDIITGPPFGNIQVTMALFETSRQEFETPVTFQLGAISSDEVGRQGTEVNSNSPIGASIKKMSIQLWNHQTNDWSVKVTVWDNGQVNTNNNWNSQLYESSDGQNSEFKDAYFSGNPTSQGGCMGLDPCPYPLYENTVNLPGTIVNRNGHIISTRVDHYRPWEDQYDLGCYYNTLFEHGRGLIVKPVNELSGSSNLNGKLDKWAHHSFGSGMTSWYIQEAVTNASDAQDAIDDIDAFYSAGIGAWNGGTSGSPYGGMYSKQCFMHDYVLGKDASGSNMSATDVDPSGKIRIAIWPYAEDSGDGDRDYWGAVVELFDLVNAGSAYCQGQQFELEWPPEQPKGGTYQSMPGQTPYFPKDDPSYSFPNEVIVPVRSFDDDDDNTFTPREAFYQESHNRNSNIWLLCQHKVERIKFKITIDEVT